MTSTMTSTMSPTQTLPRQHADAAQVSPSLLKAYIAMRLRLNETPRQIADAVQARLGIAIDPDHVIPFGRGEIALPTQTEHRPDKESVQFAEDEPAEPLFTRMAEAETPAGTAFSIAPESTQTGRRQIAISPQDTDAAATQTGHRQIAISPQDTDAAATQTGHRQNAVSPQDTDSVATQTGHRQNAVSPQDTDSVATQTGRRQDAISPRDADDPATQTGRRQDAISPQDTDAAATQTGRRPNQKPPSVLTDEVKAFIVRGLARYETPTRVAASVQLEFGIAIDRRQVYAYDPAGSRPPAQRWIDLHAATRAKFLDAMGEIGIAQKVVRLRMLDRFANRAEEGNQWVVAARFLVQAARECGGFYERYGRPKGGAAPACP